MTPFIVWIISCVILIMRQKVAIARALIHDPKLLFFDEPTANLDRNLPGW